MRATSSNPRQAAALLVLLAAWLGCASQGDCDTRYAAPTGDPLGACTQAKPCASLARAADLLSPGDTLAVAARETDAWLEKQLALAAREADRYRGVVGPPSADRRQVWGFVRLATTFATELRPTFPSAALAIPNLVEAINEHTRLAAAVGGHTFIGTPDFERSPFAYMTADRAFELTEPEVAALGRYLRSGGFVLADNALSSLPHAQAEASLRHMFRAALGRVEGTLRRIPTGHALYRCFYEIGEGPPPGLDQARGAYYLEGIFLDSQLVAVYADQGYVHAWALNYGNEAQLRMGINAVVYALTRPGSLAGQVHLTLTPTE